MKLVDPDGAFDEDRNRLDKEDFKIDRFGLRIVLHYLYGSGKEMIIENNPKWTNMIKNAPAPPYGELAGITLEQQIKNAIKKYVNEGTFDQGVAYFFSISIDAEIDNGEDITGYNYLHHANGGVSFIGLLTINESGVLAATYVAEWNDIMDPNDQYVSDRRKAKLAKIISFGQSKDYYSKLTWVDSTTFNLED